MSQGQPELPAWSELLDRQAIWDCMLRYARGVDRLDEDLIRSAYWPDARDAHGPVGGTVDEFLGRWIPQQGTRQVAYHFLGNHLVRLEGAVADAETYFVSNAKPFDSDAMEMVGGRYLDRFERRGEEWRIATRAVILDWQCVTDAAEMAARLARANTGSRDTDDPSYAVLSDVVPLLAHGAAGSEGSRDQGVGPALGEGADEKEF